MRMSFLINGRHKFIDMKPKTLLFTACILFSACVKNTVDTASHATATSADNQAGPGDPTQPPYTIFKKVGSGQLSNSRSGVVAAGTGNKVVFAGGQSFNTTTRVYTAYSTVDIFDATTYVRTTANLSQARFHHAAAAAGNKIVIAGGKTAAGTVLNTVDIYDVSTNTWSTAQLSEARSHLTGAAAGNTIIFAGGLNSQGKNTKRVDLYDVSTDTWTSGDWGTLKSLPVAAGANSRIAIAGELVNSNNDAVEIYTALALPSWTYVSPLSVVRTPDAAAGAGKKILFAGGKDLVRVDIYNTETASWGTKDLTEPRSFMGGGSLGKYVVFAGGRCFACPGEFSNRMDIYNTETNNWGHMFMSQRQAGLVMATASNRLFIGGGSDYDNYYTNIDIYGISLPPPMCSVCIP
jgi:Kelch motif/Galactose oxidase, central domain